MMNKKSKKSSKPTRNRSTPLSGYKRDKKVLTPPLATIPGMVLSSWVNNRMPDMIWAILIRRKHPGDPGYAIFREILGWLSHFKGGRKIKGITHSAIAEFDADFRKKFIAYIIEQAGTDALRPLLILKELPAYDDWKAAVGSTESNPEHDYHSMAEAVADVSFHQTQEATDVRWVKLMGTILTDNLHMTAESIEHFVEYPYKFNQRFVRPSIRSAEMVSEMNPNDGAPKDEWPERFWKAMYEETLCIPEVNETSKVELSKRYKDISDDKKYYGKPLDETRQDLINHFFNTSNTTAIDARHETVMGLALYALDTFIENIILQTAGTVSGRVTVRIIFETYITLKYLMEKEVAGEALWDTYRTYGAGQISLIERKYEDEGYKSDMVDIRMMDSIANEDKWSEYVPINFGNWDASDIRTISTDVGEKDLYDKYYPYTSGYIHANWGAVREASMQECINPLHRSHRIPSYGLPALPGVNEDCRQILNKIFELVNLAYPGYKKQLHKRPSVKAKKEKTDK